MQNSDRVAASEATEAGQLSKIGILIFYRNKQLWDKFRTNFSKWTGQTNMSVHGMCQYVGVYMCIVIRKVIRIEKPAFNFHSHTTATSTKVLSANKFCLIVIW